tara:strand:- start:726 stop:983 length:258 start_codon:yes stop_codon:yes gene_type:complete
MWEILFHIVLTIFISIFIIYCCHYSWEHIKDTYTDKKTKDLVNTQISKYQQMMDEMQINIRDTSIEKTNMQTMDEDLTKFMEEQM